MTPTQTKPTFFFFPGPLNYLKQLPSDFFCINFESFRPSFGPIKNDPEEVDIPGTRNNPIFNGSLCSLVKKSFFM